MRQHDRSPEAVEVIPRDGRGTDLLTRQSAKGNSRSEPLRRQRRGRRTAVILAAGTLIFGGIFVVRRARQSAEPVTIITSSPVTDTGVGQSDVPITFYDACRLSRFGSAVPRPN